MRTDLLFGPFRSDNLYRVSDAHFTEPRLAELYDPLDPDRGDLAPYAAIADEFDVVTVLDIGCGTGTFACLLAQGARTLQESTPPRPLLRWPAGSPAPTEFAGSWVTAVHFPRCRLTWPP